MPASESRYDVIMVKKKKDKDLEKWHAEYRKKHKDTIEFAKKMRREKELGIKEKEDDSYTFSQKTIGFIRWLTFIDLIQFAKQRGVVNPVEIIFRLIVIAIIIGAIFLIKNFF